jgi:zinc transporter ZupT
MHHVVPWLLSGAAAMITYVVIVELMPVVRSGGRALLTYTQAGFMLLGLIGVSGTHLLL